MSQRDEGTRHDVHGSFRIPEITLVTLVLVLLMSNLAFGTGNQTLDNGLVQVNFNPDSGLFEVNSISSNGIRLFDAGPAFGENNQASLAPSVAGVHRESFQDPIGRGEKLVVQYRAQVGVPSFRYELKLYEGKPWLSATAHLPQGSYRLTDFDVLQGRLRVLSAIKSRVYICSGSAGGDSGVWDLGMRSLNSDAVSVIYEPALAWAIGIGFYSFYRASSSVIIQYLSANEIGIAAKVHYHGYHPQDGELRTESLFMDLGKDPLRILEEWADVGVKTVRPQFNHDTRSGLLNTWFVYGNKTSEDLVLKQTRLLHNSILPSYGVKFVIAGEWQRQDDRPGDVGDALGFGEDEVDLKLFPGGLKRAFDRIRALGIEPAYGFNYAYAAWESSMARNHPSWLIKQDRTRMDFGFPIDYSNPGAQKWLYDLAHRAVLLNAHWLWTDFNGGPTRGSLYDPHKIMGFEDVRDGLRAIRMGTGPGVIREFVCCGPYFASLGLVDRVRTGDDMVAIGNWQGLKDIARQLAATYMLDQRFWIVDSDAIFVGGGNAVHDSGAGNIPPDASTLDEVRMRLQLLLSSGSFVTIGENIADFDANRMHLLTLVLPTYGQPARPLDMFLHTTPEIYDLRVNTKWDQWHVLMLQNWENQDQNYDIRFSDLGLDSSRTYLVFGFWDQALIGKFRGRARLSVIAHTGRSFVIREVPKNPWVLSTDMHLTQGGVELKDVQYREDSKQLSGIALRHPGAKGHVVVYVPSGYRVESASGPCREVRVPSDARLAYLELRFANETAPWWLRFTTIGDRR